MTDVEMDETFSMALRAALVEEVEANARSVPRRWSRAGAVSLVALCLAGSGVAVASQLLTAPGADVVEAVAVAVTTTRTGSATIDLGEVPADATGVLIHLTCLTEGAFSVPGGAELTCSEADAGRETASWTIPLAPEQQTIAVATDGHAKWRLSATYSTIKPTRWGINERGQTFGVQNDKGTPDLVTVVATNGKVGYAYAKDLRPADPIGAEKALRHGQALQHLVTVPVYKSDGKTRIGVFGSYRSIPIETTTGPRE